MASVMDEAAVKANAKAKAMATDLQRERGNAEKEGRRRIPSIYLVTEVTSNKCCDVFYSR